MAYPTAKVEIAFTDSPYTVSPTWTDVTPYVRSMTVDRGRSDDWSPFNGYASVTFNNRDRRFDPFNTSSPYSPNLQPRKQIRITANADPNRTNLVTNPSFETNTTGWTPNSSTVARITSDFVYGSACAQVTSSATNYNNIVTGFIPVTAGLQYTLSAYCRNVSGSTRTVYIAVQWFTAAGVYISETSSGSQGTLSIAAGWVRRNCTGTAPATATQAKVVLLSGTTGLTAGWLTNFDGVLFEQSSSAGSYFDGSFTGYGWNGTANASTSSSVYQPVFRGFIDGFPPQWTDAGQDSTVTVSCFDAIGLLSSETLPADWSVKYITSTNPLHYWRMDEPIQPFLAGQTLKDYGSYPRDMTTTAVASSGQQLAVGLVNSSLQGTGDIAAQTGTGNVAAVTPFSVSMWAILDPDNNNVYGEASDCFWGITFDATNSKYVVIIQKNATALQYRYDTVDKYDGAQPRMLSFIFNPGVFFGLYIDGVLVATTAATSATVYIPTGDKTFIEGAQVQQLIVWDSAQTATTFQEIYKYSTTAFAETTSARFNRIIGETSFPAGLTSVPASPAASVLDITDNAPTVAGELQKVADSEFAPLFVTRDGVLTMYQQNQIRTQTRSIVSQATFGAGGYPLGQDIQLRLDGDSMRNVANVTMSQGGVYIQKNTDSISTYGAAEASVDTEVLALSNAVQIGNIVTGWGGQVYAAAEPFEVMLSPTASWGFALDLELNDRITLAVAPPTGATITIPMLLSRITHTVTAGQWQTTFEGSARWAALFILNSSKLNGTDLLG